MLRARLQDYQESGSQNMRQAASSAQEVGSKEFRNGE